MSLVPEREIIDHPCIVPSLTDAREDTQDQNAGISFCIDDGQRRDTPECERNEEESVSPDVTLEYVGGDLQKAITDIENAEKQSPFVIVRDSKVLVKCRYDVRISSL